MRKVEIRFTKEGWSQWSIPGADKVEKVGLRSIMATYAVENEATAAKDASVEDEHGACESVEVEGKPVDTPIERPSDATDAAFVKALKAKIEMTTKDLESITVKKVFYRPDRTMVDSQVWYWQYLKHPPPTVRTEDDDDEVIKNDAKTMTTTASFTRAIRKGLGKVQVSGNASEAIFGQFKTALL
jgi:hypothetical protein